MYHSGTLVAHRSGSFWILLIGDTVITLLSTLKVHHEWATWAHHRYFLWENSRCTHILPNQYTLVTWPGTLRMCWPFSASEPLGHTMVSFYGTFKMYPWISQLGHIGHMTRYTVNVLSICHTRETAGKLAGNILNVLMMYWMGIGQIHCPCTYNVLTVRNVPKNALFSPNFSLSWQLKDCYFIQFAFIVLTFTLLTFSFLSFMTFRTCKTKHPDLFCAGDTSSTTELQVLVVFILRAWLCILFPQMRSLCPVWRLNSIKTSQLMD